MENISWPSRAEARASRSASQTSRPSWSFEGAFTAAAAARAGALLVHPTGHLDRHARRIAELAAKSRLPAMYGLRVYVEAGGLMSYGADVIEIWRRAAIFVDKILKGTKPGDLPVEQPTKFEMLINLQAARSIGLTIPQQVLLGPTEVVQRQMNSWNIPDWLENEVNDRDRHCVYCRVEFGSSKKTRTSIATSRRQSQDSESAWADDSAVGTESSR